ncbi:hypothetical protein SD71_02780 [Cohnella kolymensis]|uniref:Protein PsiE n=1 Tax=Cohnella kolymensis TaxID=1590652 RepID=A0ABR5A958_9BACL|nr:phosphate-starvation-inducible PsiE family protein [Cohnella kolymensis]KIL37558.1 hypothetical protein SD71_02780 [Cohnella kolymensis]
MTISKWIRNVVHGSQFVMNVSLISVMIILLFLMLKEVGSVAYLAWTGTADVHEVLIEVVNFFLYFAFISMILVYFKENYHFPLQNLLYIGMTATLRFIIINRDNAMQNVLLAIVIVLLLIGYVIISPKHRGNA